MLSTSAFFVSVLASSLLTSIGASAIPEAAAPARLATGTDHWCGKWAGSPDPSDAVGPQQLPPYDFTRRFFVEPQLQRVPFAPIQATEPKVQVPKLWGNSNAGFESRNKFRVALMTYAQSAPPRVYSSSKSRWADVHNALGRLMNECVNKGVGGAYLVVPSPGLGQSTLVVYAYEAGSQFDFQMNYYMTNPHGIDPARLAPGLGAANVSTSTPIETA
ncbi:MAG: hypothetical protein Q9169_006985 [Polycauliona sp. 2 TL-2023]